MKKKNNEEGLKIHANLILEILGRPPEHLVESLNKIIGQIDNEKSVKVIKRDVKEPKKIKRPEKKETDPQNNQDFYTSFGEIEIEIESLSALNFLMFKYMPAHIEIISPESLTLKNGEWNDILNELARKLHRYDEIARVLQIEKNVLEKKLKAMTGMNTGESEEE